MGFLQQDDDGGGRHIDPLVLEPRPFALDFEPILTAEVCPKLRINRVGIIVNSDSGKVMCNEEVVAGSDAVPM